jgi:asparagine synthetase B (glutamine-hydrolysing)
MCGIYCCLSRHGFAQVPENTRELLRHRGPDTLQEQYIECHGFYLTFISSVLSLRGDTIVSQPLIDDQTRSILCWNGEAWLVDNQTVIGNDSKAVFDLLLSAASEINPAIAIPEAFSRIQGPFACVFYDSRQSQLYFGRDGLGRRSLVTTTSENGNVIISSVSTPDHKSWVEVEANGIHVINLSKSVRLELDNKCFDISVKTRCFADETEGCNVSAI